MIESIEKKREEVKSYVEELEKRLIAHETKLHNIESTIAQKEEEKKAVSQKLVELFREFGDLEEAKKNALSSEQLGVLEREIEEYLKERASVEERIKDLEEKIGSIEVDDPDRIMEEHRLLKERLERLVRDLGDTERNLKVTEERLKRKDEISKRVKEIKKEMYLYSRLAEDLKSNRIQEFVASMMLESIVEIASENLYKFTNTYQLSLTDDGEIMVVDRVQGVERSVRSLSGGETFLASLSLALGVSDVLSDRAHLESLFIDEGFGSLDEETRERVSDILDTVRQNINRMVGIISHIPDLAERFHQKILVKKQGDFSTVEVIY